MNVRKYEFEYDGYQAEVHFKVDLDVFTEEMARETLEFFLWDYDKEANPIDEVMKKYAIETIRFASIISPDMETIIKRFDNLEGYYPVHGLSGIYLTYVEAYVFDEDLLNVRT